MNYLKQLTKISKLAKAYEASIEANSKKLTKRLLRKDKWDVK